MAQAPFAAAPMRTDAQEITNSRGFPVDPVRYPLLSTYLRGLPRGIHSYPECAVLGAAFRQVQQEQAPLWEDPALPLAIRTAMTRTLAPGEFVSLVSVAVQSLIVRDRRNVSQQDYLARARGMTAQILDATPYRAIVAVMSPQMLLLGLNWRWEKFFRGIKLVSLGGERTGHKLILRAPAGVLTDTWRLYFCQSFTEVLLLTHARRPRVTHHCISDTDTMFMLRWE